MGNAMQVQKSAATREEEKLRTNHGPERSKWGTCTSKSLRARRLPAAESQPSPTCMAKNRGIEEGERRRRPRQGVKPKER